jgi:hypothetical protein
LISFVAVALIWQWFAVAFAAWLPIFTAMGTYLLGVILIATMAVGLIHSLGSLINAVKALFIKESADDQ